MVPLTIGAKHIRGMSWRERCHSLLALCCVAFLLATTCVGVAMSRVQMASQAVYGLSLLASLTALAVALVHLVGGAAIAPTVTLPLGLPWLGAHFRVDVLGAFFLVVVNLGAAAASLFALGYGRHEAAPATRAAVLSGVPRRHESRRARRRRLHFSRLLGIHVARRPGRWSWRTIACATMSMPATSISSWRASARSRCCSLSACWLGRMAVMPSRHMRAESVRSAGIAAVVLILVLIGAGSKAGLVPLHVWLPLAHPAAPSHVSALMSGVMTKVAVYGFIRIVFDLLGPPAWWWSIVVLALGGITACMGVLYALMQHDLKRLLAYHTVENIGIIFIGLGLALAFKAHGMPCGGGARARPRAVSRLQPFAVQEPAVLRRRRRADGDRRARHGASRRPHPSHAADRLRVPRRLRRDLGVAAAQRLRLRMADLSGDPAEPATAVMGAEVPGARGRRACSRSRRRSPPPASSRHSA